MRRMKKVSISTYISVRVIGIVLLMAAMMIIFTTYFSNKMIKNDIMNQLMLVSRHDEDYIKIKKGQVKILNKFIYEEDGITKVVLRENGQLVGGQYPDEEIANYSIRKMKMRQVECKPENYYIFDRSIKKWNSEKKESEYIIVRSIVKKSDITSKYQTLKYILYISIFIYVAFSFLIVLFISAQITEPMKLICNTAEKIGREKDLSKRIQYEGPFEDIEILAQANNRMLDKLEQMFEQQIQFNSDVAHELRTPVSVVLAECQYARKHMDNKEDFDVAVSVIEKQVRKTNQIITQLLYLSRLDQNSIQANFEMADLNEIIEYICEDEMIKDQKHIHIKLCLQNVEAYVDVNLIMIAMRNLINNAMKYSPEGSEIEVTLKKEEGNIIFSVRDHGCGMSKEDRENIFNRFYRVDKSRNSEGFGLGLSIAKKIIQMHHGNIVVESQENVGSTFWIYLPWENHQEE